VFRDQHVCVCVCDLQLPTIASRAEMEFYQYQPQCSPLSTSSQNSSTSSSDDELGLKGLVQGVYAPYLTAELERLFVAEVCIVTCLSSCVCGVHMIFVALFCVGNCYELGSYTSVDDWTFDV